MVGRLRSRAIRISATPHWCSRSRGAPCLLSTFQPVFCSSACPSLPRSTRLSVQTLVSMTFRNPASTSFCRRFWTLRRLVLPKCQRRIWEVVSTCETPQDQRMFLSRLVSLVMVWLREFGGQSACIAPHYSGYSPAEGTHLEEMPAVGEGTRAAPQSHQGNGDTTLAEYSGSAGQAQEREMFPQ